MTQEDNELLLKDICARLPYGVKISWRNNDVEYKVFELISITSKKYKSYIENGKELAVNGEYIEWRLNENKMGKFYKFATLSEFIKPYLRPMSSMTEEEKEEYRHSRINDKGEWTMHGLDDYCYEHHFDFRGLIEKGLALEAPEGMYKTE